MLENSDNSYRYFTRSGLRVQIVCSLQEQPLHICASSTLCTLAKKSSRFWTCSPSFPSSYCAQLPCHQHPRGNRGQQAKTYKSKSIVWPLEASPPSFFWHGRQAGGQVLPCSHIATCLDRASAPPPGCRYGAAARNFQLGFSFEAFVRAAVEAGWEQRTCCLGAPSGFRLKRENYEHNRSVHT